MSDMVERVARAIADTTDFDGGRMASRYADSELRDMAQAAIAAMQADAAPVAWMYVHPSKDNVLPPSVTTIRHDRRDWVKMAARGWTETPLYAHPPVADRVSTSSPVDVSETPETSGKLRDAVEVWREAYEACFIDSTECMVISNEEAAAAVIEADRAALVAEIVADLRGFAPGEMQFPDILADEIAAMWGGK